MLFAALSCFQFQNGSSSFRFALTVHADKRYKSGSLRKMAAKVVRFAPLLCR